MCDHSCKRETHFRKFNAPTLLWVEDCSHRAIPPVKLCLVHPASQGRAPTPGKVMVLKGSELFLVLYPNHTCEYHKMSLLVGLHPSHTQMALKDPFLFSVSVNFSYFTHALNVSVASSGSCFWPQSVLWISSSILRAFATTWRIPGMGLHRVGHD